MGYEEAEAREMMADRIEDLQSDLDRLRTGIRKLAAEYRMSLHSSTYADDLEALLSEGNEP